VQRIRAATVFVILSFTVLPALGGEFQEDLKARRARAMERLGPEAALILWSAPSQVYSRDVNFEYRQDSNLYYLTGIDQEQSILVLMPGNKTRKEFLFIRPRDPVREHWEGRRLSAEEAKAQSGIDTIYLTSEFDSFIDAILAGSPSRSPADRFPGEYDSFL
jgi:Xaa-Pro aminopeptidase